MTRMPTQLPCQRRTSQCQNILLTDVDRWRLGRLLLSRETKALAGRHSRFELEAAVEEADVVRSELTPPSLVTMNSTVTLIDPATGESKNTTLVYPEDRDLIPQSVGVFQELGRRLLGRHVGDSVELTEGDEPVRFRIAAIVYQPEAAAARA
jgi:regulator of nucleoside diphosphate kinase